MKKMLLPLFLCLQLITNAQFFNADLTVSNLNYTYDPNSHTITSLSYDMNNISTEDGFEQVTNSIYITDGASVEFLLDEQVSTHSFGMPAQTTETFNVSSLPLGVISALTKGNYFIGIVVDDSDEEDEEDESNNILLSANKIPFKLFDPEAIFGSFEYDFQTAVLSIIDFDIKNNGPNFVPGGIKCDLYLTGIGSDEYLIGSSTTSSSGIDAGKEENVSFTDVDLDNISGLKTGSYFLKIVVDADNKFDEEDEGNNAWTLTGPNVEISFESINTSIFTNTISKSLNVYPNPFNENFSFKNEGNYEKMRIFNLQGQLIDIVYLSNGESVTINTSHYEDGLYVMELIGGRGIVERQKLLKAPSLY